MVEEQLAQRLREAATARRTTTGVLVAQAIEALLAGNSASPAPPPSAQAALEARVALLEQAASPERVILPPHVGDAGPLSDRRLTPAEAAGLLTTPEVAKALGLATQSAHTNWIARQAGNGVGAVYRGYCLRGKALLPGGQKPGWLWELHRG